MKLNEDIFEIDIPEVDPTPELTIDDIEQETVATPAENGVATLLINSISDTWNKINDYNSIISTISSSDIENAEEITSVVKDVVDEEHENVGKLMSALTSISPNTENVEVGQEEADMKLTEANNGTAQSRVAELKRDGKLISDSHGYVTEDGRHIIRGYSRRSSVFVCPETGSYYSSILNAYEDKYGKPITSDIDFTLPDGVTIARNPEEDDSSGYMPRKYQKYGKHAQIAYELDMAMKRAMGNHSYKTHYFDTLEDAKKYLKDSGYKYITSDNRAYMDVNDLGNKDSGVQIKKKDNKYSIRVFESLKEDFDLTTEEGKEAACDWYSILMQNNLSSDSQEEMKELDKLASEQGLKFIMTNETQYRLPNYTGKPRFKLLKEDFENSKADLLSDVLGRSISTSDENYIYDEWRAFYNDPESFRDSVVADMVIKGLNTRPVNESKRKMRIKEAYPDNDYSKLINISYNIYYNDEGIIDMIWSKVDNFRRMYNCMIDNQYENTLNAEFFNGYNKAINMSFDVLYNDEGTIDNIWSEIHSFQKIFKCKIDNEKEMSKNWKDLFHESLTEELRDATEDEYFDMMHDVYNALANVAFKYSKKGIEFTSSQWDDAYEWWGDRFFIEDFHESLKEALHPVDAEDMRWYMYQAVKNIVDKFSPEVTKSDVKAAMDFALEYVDFVGLDESLKEDIENLEDVDVEFNPVMQDAKEHSKEATKHFDDELEEIGKEFSSLKNEQEVIGAEKQEVPKMPEEPKATLDESLFDDYRRTRRI